MICVHFAEGCALPHRLPHGGKAWYVFNAWRL